MCHKWNLAIIASVNIKEPWMIKYTLKTYITEYILSERRLSHTRQRTENKRLKVNLPHTLEVFLAIDDPLSYLLLQALPELQSRYKISIKFAMVLNKTKAMFPDIEKWDQNILKDCVQLSQLYGLDSPLSLIKTQTCRVSASEKLVCFEHRDDFITQALPIFAAYWHDQAAELTRLLSFEADKMTLTPQQALRRNEAYLAKRGHYLSASIFYGGEWYWGLERIQYLERRLNILHSKPEADVKYNKLHNICIDKKDCERQQKTTGTNVLTMYFSVRSPYSYLGLIRAQKIAHLYNIPLRLKPVLPMLMRGLPVPPKKSLYIGLDVKREALCYGIEFGKIADPLGKGVERCYSLFEYAESQGKSIEFMSNFMRCVWSQRVRSETNKGLKKIVELSGLEWQQAIKYINNEGWRVWADDNLNQLYALGLWGVPSFHYNDTLAFGQDKLLFIEQAIRKDLYPNSCAKTVY
jgi:2-hydroxychromene-2-carboxylate isomerase